MIRYSTVRRLLYGVTSTPSMSFTAARRYACGTLNRSINGFHLRRSRGTPTVATVLSDAGTTSHTHSTLCLWSRPRHHVRSSAAPHHTACSRRKWSGYIHRKSAAAVESAMSLSQVPSPVVSRRAIVGDASTNEHRSTSGSDAMESAPTDAGADMLHGKLRLGKTVVVGLSGGVDSAVAALLLQQQGYDVVGVFMRNWDSNDEEGEESCTVDADQEDVEKVGKHLGIPVHTVNFSREYWHDVFAPSLEEIERGRTPNFDVSCNRFIKFDAFTSYAFRTLGADLVATGHYARTGPGAGGDWGKPVLLQAHDDNKDQTYFLSAVSSSALRRVVFPLGDLTKPEVRKLAAEALLPVAEKRESMGICFVGKRRSWKTFVSQYVKPHRGSFVCVDSGKVLGAHEGMELYTIGQKANISGMPTKYYVAGFDKGTSSVIVAEGFDHRALYAAGLCARARNFRWVAGVPPAELSVLDHEGSVEGVPSGSPAAHGRGTGRSGSLRCFARTRHRHPLVPCTVEMMWVGREDIAGRRTKAEDRECETGDRDPGANGDDSDGGDDEVSDWGRSRSEVTVADQVGSRRGSVRDTKDAGASDGAKPLPEKVVVTRDDTRATAETLRRVSRHQRPQDGSALHAHDRISSSGVEKPPGLDPPKVLERDGGEALLLVTFDEPLKAVAPGQTVAFYKDSICLGGGPILRSEGQYMPVRYLPPPPPPEPVRPRRHRNVKYGETAGTGSRTRSVSRGKGRGDDDGSSARSIFVREGSGDGIAR